MALVRVGSLVHGYAEVEGGSSFYTELLIGTTLPIVGRGLNRLIRRFAFSEGPICELWPKAVEDGLIPTDNAMGIMTEEPSPAAEPFIELAARAGRPLLEIGAAYGNATLPALRAGGTVIANDLSASQLGVLTSATPEEDRKRLVLMPARFPEEIRLGDGSLSGVLAAQVLHFFDAPTVELSFQSVRRWLEPSGAPYVVMMTPSLGFYSRLRPEYEKRARRGERWPGIFDPRTVATPDWKERLPPVVHLFEKDVLRRCAEEAGFTVETLEYFCFRQFPAKQTATSGSVLRFRRGFGGRQTRVEGGIR